MHRIVKERGAAAALDKCPTKTYLLLLKRFPTNHYYTLKGVSCQVFNIVCRGEKSLCNQHCVFCSLRGLLRLRGKGNGINGLEDLWQCSNENKVYRASEI